MRQGEALKYRVVEADSSDELTLRVAMLMKEDSRWTPMGGVAMSHSTYNDRDENIVSTVVYAQAMVKP